VNFNKILDFLSRVAGVAKRGDCLRARSARKRIQEFFSK